jgi:hypothetical protein
MAPNRRDRSPFDPSSAAFEKTEPKLGGTRWWPVSLGEIWVLWPGVILRGQADQGWKSSCVIHLAAAGSEGHGQESATSRGSQGNS